MDRVRCEAGAAISRVQLDSVRRTFMSTVAESPVMTTEELFALPDDGIDRELIRGQLRERPMTKRNRRHSRIEASVAHLLKEWLERQPGPRGEVVSGEAGFRIRRDPDTTVGID